MSSPETSNESAPPELDARARGRAERIRAVFAKRVAENAQKPSAELAWPEVDRRKIPDRRKRPTRWWESLLGHRRRTRGRRAGESKNIYVDIYHNADLLLIGSVFLLNCIDAVMTLQLVRNGQASELNPMMAGLLERGTGAFLLEKVALVGFCLTSLMVHKTFTLARYGVYGLLFSYGCLTIYHLIIQVRVASAGF